MIFWVVAGTLPLFMLFIWIELSKQGATGSYSSTQFSAYFLLVFLIRHMTPFVPIAELEHDIRHGDLSAQLLRPIDPIWLLAASHAMDILHRLPVTIPVVLLGLYLSGGFEVLVFDHAPLFAAALLGAVALNFIVLYAAGLVAFWMERVRGFETLIWNGYFVFGGGLAPIAFFPGWVRELVTWLPFRYMLSFPIEIAVGGLSSAQIQFGFAALAFWLVASIALMRMLWRLGLRQYSAYGS
jgi:ABC-2 type transport system permease protein